MTSKEALKIIRKEISYVIDDDDIYDRNVDLAYRQIAKDLEVLDILKEKKVDITYLRNLIELNEGNEFEKYNKNCGIAYIPITEDEFNIMKEWLKNGK